MRVRLLDVTLGDPCSNLAAEEAIFKLMRAPTVRLWDNQKSVVIGRAQLAELETDVSYCEQEGIPVVRRFTAGGTVYNGPGNLNWSFFVPRKVEDGAIRYSRDAKGIFSTFAGLIVKALGCCSVEASFEPPNRIVCAEGKVSGMAAYISNTGAVCHGTLLTHADLAEVARLTTPKGASAQRRYPRSNVARVANVGVDRGKFVEKLLDTTEADCEEAPLERDELALTLKLERERYRRESWNLGDPFELDYA
ncbi:MAG: lipoate--protein ligase family protein [Nitrososphaerales archaeon]|nr:lipoate--protein ligase family protein [Nitrososphaerales archaeon]